MKGLRFRARGGGGGVEVSIFRGGRGLSSAVVPRDLDLSCPGP